MLHTGTPSQMPPGDGFFTSDLSATDPDMLAAIAREDRRQRNQIELLAPKNYLSRAARQVLGSIVAFTTIEGHPGRRWHAGMENLPPGCHRKSCDQSCARALPLQLRKCSAALGNSGEPGSLLRFARAWQHDTQHGARGGRTSESRLASQPVGQVVQTRSLWRSRGRRVDRLRRLRGSLPPAPAEIDYHRGLLLSAGVQLRAVSQARRRSRSLFTRRHRPFLRARGCGRLSQSVPVCPCGHDDDEQEPARSAWRTDLVRRRRTGPTAQFRRVPRNAGRFPAILANLP